MFVSFDDGDRTAGFLQIRCRRETARYSCANNDDVKLFSTVLHQISLFTHRTLCFLLDLLRKSTGCSWNTTPTVPADLIFVFVRKGMIVVLGLIGSKIPQFEGTRPIVAPDRRGGEIRCARSSPPGMVVLTGAAACFFRSDAATRWGRCRPEWSWVDRMNPEICALLEKRPAAAL
jgi:hypothetical protein